jgi:hypothetical protein
VGLVNYAVFVTVGRSPLVFRLDEHEGEATPIAMETAPAAVVRYARSLEAWADNRPMPAGGLAPEFFTGMHEVCPTGITVAVDEAAPVHLHQAA